MLFPFFFLHKNSPFIQVFSSTSTLERSFIIFFWAQKKCDEGGTDRLSTSAVRIDLFNYFINSYVTSVTYTEIQQNTGGRGWGPTRGEPPSRAPPWMSQNQTVKCTLLLSINREATLKKKKYSGERMLEPGKQTNEKKKKQQPQRRKKKKKGKKRN